MGKIKDALNHICHRMDDVKFRIEKELSVLESIDSHMKNLIVKLDDLQEWIQSIDHIACHQKDELVTLNNMLSDFGEMLEEQQTASQDAQLLRVMPAENAGKEALFVVTGDELANLLEACSGATLRMKKKEADKK